LTSDDAYEREMTRKPRLNRDTAERLLEGRETAFPRLSEILAAAAAPSLPEETAAAARLSPVLAAEARMAADRPLVARRPGRSRRRRIAFGAIAVAALLVLSSSLAAFGALPGAAQAVAHDVLSTLGIHVPGPNAHAGDHPNTRGNSTTHTPNEHANARSTVKATPKATPPVGRGARPTPTATPHSDHARVP
jgi:hypothetical protein